MKSFFRLLLTCCVVILFLIWFWQHYLIGPLDTGGGGSVGGSASSSEHSSKTFMEVYLNTIIARRKNVEYGGDDDDDDILKPLNSNAPDGIEGTHEKLSTINPDTTTSSTTTTTTTTIIIPSTTITTPEAVANVLTEVTKKRRKRILIFTALFGEKTWRDIPLDYKFTEVDGTPCPVNDCEVTYDKNNVNNTDAVFFHGRDISELQPGYLQKLRRVNPKQIWIWMMHESPLFTYYNLTLYDEFFNWTATYRPSSEIFIPYFGIMQLTDTESRPVPGTNFAASKDKKVLVVISHCDDYRMNMIRKLKQYINVDLYGACKDIINPELQQCVRNTEQCEQLQARYKFYFAIENSYCTDYLTEKYYRNGLKRHIVPVVLSGGNFSNTDIVLPHSFINILDFNDMKGLGEYLNYLDSNDTAYNEYHAWSYTHKVDLRHGMCKTCKALWEHEVHSKIPNKKLSDVWDSNKNCISYEHEMFQKYLV